MVKEYFMQNDKFWECIEIKSDYSKKSKKL